MIRTSIRQRADLTHKHNLDKKRHGWLRLTPAYSLKLVDRIVDMCDSTLSVLDPFAGTCTTPLAAAQRGHDALGVDVNPFLVWLGKVKLATYSDFHRQKVQHALEAIFTCIADVKPVAPPPIYRIDRWWHPNVLAVLRSLRAAINAVARNSPKVRDLLDVAFCRTIIALSNAAFDHQSMSFAHAVAQDSYSDTRCCRVFGDSVHDVLSGLRPNPRGDGRAMLGDSRRIHEVVDKRYDLVITSPPYPNRISYVRELRPYMYWLGYLRHAKDAGELDWKAVGGTWGMATSRLNDWEPATASYEPTYLTAALSQIASSSNKNGTLLARYVRKYFHDIWLHMQSLKRAISGSGRVIYVIGNSTFYGVLVPSERIYLDMLRESGFSDARATVIRKRNSKKELYEFAVEGVLSGKLPAPRQQLELFR